MSETAEVMQIERPDTTELAAEGANMVTHAQAFIVDSADSYEKAAGFLRHLKTLRDRIKERFADSKAKAHAAHKSIVAWEKETDAPPMKAMRIFEDKRMAWSVEAERKRRVEERRLQDEALKRAEEERLAEAERLEREGRAEQADAVLEAPIATPAVVLPTAVPRIAGVSVRTIWKVRVVDVSLIPRKWMIPNEKALGTHARSCGAAAVGTIPGVEFYPETSEAVRGY